MFAGSWDVAGAMTGTVLAQGGVNATELPAPTGLAINTTTDNLQAVPAGTYYYRVSATNSLGESLACAEVGYTVVTGPAAFRLTWNPVLGATGYRIYGRTSGAELFIAASASASYLEINLNITPSGALPAINTSGGVLATKGLAVTTSAAQPTASVANRGLLWVVQGGTGVGDEVQMCMKGTADTYSWVSIKIAP